MPKYADIAAVLKEEIQKGVYASTGRIPTEFELVERFSVSRQTVRQAINCLKTDGFLYQIQGSGTYILDPFARRQGRVCRGERNVTVISTYISDYIFPNIICGIEKALSSAGIGFNLVATGNRVDVERRILQRIIETSDVDGLIVEGTKTAFPNPNIDLYHRIEALGIPVVFLHSTYPELQDAVVVGMDDYHGGRLSASYLLKKGCHQISAIFKSDDRQGLQRYRGFCDELLAQGVGLENAKIRWYTTEDILSSGLHIGSKKVLSIADAEGFVVYNDRIATALVRDFKACGMGLSPIFSFDHSALCLAYPEQIYSIGHRKEELGRLAAEKTIRMMEGEKENSFFFQWEMPEEM